MHSDLANPVDGDPLKFRPDYFTVNERIARAGEQNAVRKCAATGDLRRIGFIGRKSKLQKPPQDEQGNRVIGREKLFQEQDRGSADVDPNRSESVHAKSRFDLDGSRNCWSNRHG